jgi:hypothetical protein
VADIPRSRPQLGSTIRPTVRAVLDRLEPTPALVINRVGDIIAWTLGGHRLFGPIGILDGSPPNINRFVFTDPRAKQFMPDWGRTADAVVDQLRRSGDGPDTAAMIAELSRDGGSEFTDRMGTTSDIGNPFGEAPIDHPTAGALRLAYETLDLAIVDDQYLIICLPADDRTRQAFERLADRTD